MKKEHRWLKSAIAASAEPLPALPWARATRRKPAALTAAPIKSRAMAAR